MFGRLILAHLVGDFVLQNRWLVVRKRTLSGLAIHIGLVGLAMLPVTWGQWGHWWGWLALILVVHGLTDWAKIRLEPRLPLPPIVPFLADQAIHVLAIATVVALSGDLEFGLPRGGEQVWWIANVYLIGTCVLSIALPLCLGPSHMMQRPPTLRPTIIVASALVLTLAWRDLPLLIPLVSTGLYLGVTRRLARTPATATFNVEFWSALLMATSLGWGLP
ncbi:MAG: DUF3307 domain-containing protein [Anaerolineae bacterium]|jgi:hypothetical protein